MSDLIAIGYPDGQTPQMATDETCRAKLGWTVSNSSFSEVGETELQAELHNVAARV